MDKLTRDSLRTALRSAIAVEFSTLEEAGRFFNADPAPFSFNNNDDSKRKIGFDRMVIFLRRLGYEITFEVSKIGPGQHEQRSKISAKISPVTPLGG